MRQTGIVLALTLAFLALLDGAVSLTLGWAERSNRFGSLVQYFEYGRSVPGKLTSWEAKPNVPGNLYDVSWRDETVATSSARFEAEGLTDAVTVRSYGMSFVNNILKEVVNIDPNLISDGHGGPGAPPNMTYALFEDDRANRRAGDVVVLGILSSSVPGMAALSNQSWVFEQPAPFTYPIYWPEGDDLRRVEPLVTSAAAHRALNDDDAAWVAWRAQLRAEDQFYSLHTYGATWLDASPFARLARRSLAISHVSRTEQAILEGSYPYEDALLGMIISFALTAREDGQVPLVFLIQSREPGDVDLLEISQPTLQAQDIPYFATAEHFDPKDRSGFEADGHYQPEIDRKFAEHVLRLLIDIAR